MYPDNTPYQPSNGTEGDDFMDCHCFHCIHDKFIHTYQSGDKQCKILDCSLAYDLKDKEYPKEWIYLNGKPTCTKYKYWNWSDGDPSEEDIEIFHDPNQLDLFTN